MLPAFALVYLIAAPTGLRRRSGGSCSAGARRCSSAAAGGSRSSRLLPAGSRPFIDGSPDNSIFNLIFGYNGLGRHLRSAVGPAVAAAAAADFSGPAGLLRLFNDLMGGAGLVAAAGRAAGAVRRPVDARGGRRAPIDRAPRCCLWGGWLLVTAVVFSFGRA